MRRDFEVLTEIIRSSVGEPHTGCELGVWKGLLSQKLLIEFSRLQLLMVDRWQTYDAGVSTRANLATQEDMYGFMQESAEVTAPFSDRRILMMGDSVRVSGFIKDRSLDFIFLDANHFYDSVTADLESWHLKVKTNGLICGHDYNARREREGYWGVKKAVDEFAEIHGYKVRTAPYHMWWYKCPNE